MRCASIAMTWYPMEGLANFSSSASRICCEPPVMCNVELVSTAKGLVCVSSAFLCVRESPFNFFR